MLDVNILQKAIDALRKAEHVSIGLLDDQGCPTVSTVSLIECDGLETLWFATGLASGKVKRIRRDNRASICAASSGNITLTGDVDIITDDAVKRALWRDWFLPHFPGGVGDPNYCILKFTTRRVSLYMDEQSEEFDIEGVTRPASRCGLMCHTCTYKASHGCAGCIESGGHPFYGQCPIAECCQDKGLTHCGQCDVMPCGQLYDYSYMGGEHGDRPQGARVSLCRHWAAREGTQAWRNVLLTSGGWWRTFDIADGVKEHIRDTFLDMLGIPPAQAKVLFIPTAAIDEDAKFAAGKCRDELLSVGIAPHNITTHDIDGTLPERDAMAHDVIYFTGGDTRHLLRRIKETGFDGIVKKMVYAGKVYVGASAGSLIATPNIGDPYDAQTAGLCLVNAYLSVHCPQGTPARDDLPLEHVALTDTQALAVSWNGYRVIEG